MPENISLLLYRYGGQSSERRHSEDQQLLHVSDLFDVCFRQVFLLQRERLRYATPIPPRLQMKFEMGIAVEAVIKSWLVEMDLLSERECRLVDENLGLVGRPDARLKNGMLLEIKAKDPNVFRLTRRAPIRKDQFQLETYLWMDQTRKGDLLTVTWGEEKNPFRDQIVAYNVKIGELVKKNVSEFRDAQAGGKMPGRTCTNEDEARAVLCPARSVCFREPGERVRTIAESLNRGKL